MVLLLAMEEEEKKEIFQAPSQFESRLSRKQGSGGSKKIIVILVSIIVIGLLIFGVLKFFTGGESSETTETPTPTEEVFPTDIPEPTETPEETPTATPKTTPTSGTTPTPTKAAAAGDSVDKTSGLDRASLSIHILNGNGTAGVSKKASDYLEGLGYNVVQIGNADNFDYEQTEIQLKSSASKYLNLLKADLGKNYTVGSTSGTPPADETADAIVIIGK